MSTTKRKSKTTISNELFAMRNAGTITETQRRKAEQELYGWNLTSAEEALKSDRYSKLKRSYTL